MSEIAADVVRERRVDGSGLFSRASVSNLGAQVGALVSVSVASLIVARAGGPTVVGEYALLRVLPWLFGVVLSCGLPTASAFFLAGEHAGDRRLRPTLTMMTVAGAVVASMAWLACTEPFHTVFFKQMRFELVAVMAVVAVTQLFTVTAKACCQGSGDITGANLVIVAEELWFVVCFPAVLVVLGNRGISSVVLALIVSGALATLTGLARLVRRGFFADWGSPSASLARRVVAFGGRGQLGNMLWLMNLRFDFVLLGGLAGPAVLGIYAVASKFAELMRLAPTALNYVLYPRFAQLGAKEATVQARRLLPRAAALTLATTPLMAAACFVGPALLYGTAFRGAVTPGEIIVLGLSIEGAAAVSSAFLLGCGRPGLNSIGMGVGAAITVTLDLILIPRWGAIGGAVTSAVTYAVTTVVLTTMANRVARAHGGLSLAPPWRRWSARDQGGGTGDGTGDDTGDSMEAAARLRHDTVLRRAVDVAAASVAIVAVAPLLLLTAAAVRATSRGPILYRQERAGKSGLPFTMFKFRSMVVDADRTGPLVTGRRDPRITRVGAILRATKLDELPQLLNVLKGDMTLIGPRPEVPRFLEWYHPEELALLDVRPGLTGPGQIFYTEVQAAEAEGGTDPEAHYVDVQLHPKLDLDLGYLRRRSLLSDVAIVLRTIGVVCRIVRRSPAAPDREGSGTGPEDGDETAAVLEGDGRDEDEGKSLPAAASEELEEPQSLVSQHP